MTMTETMMMRMTMTMTMMMMMMMMLPISLYRTCCGGGGGGGDALDALRRALGAAAKLLLVCHEHHLHTNTSLNILLPLSLASPSDPSWLPCPAQSRWASSSGKI